MMQIPLEFMNSWKTRNGAVVRMPARKGHGSLTQATQQEMIQPQDGAEDARVRMANIRSRQHSDDLHETEDARLTGATRSLDRRLLGLNVLATYTKCKSLRVETAKEIIDVA